MEHDGELGTDGACIQGRLKSRRRAQELCSGDEIDVGDSVQCMMASQTHSDVWSPWNSSNLQGLLGFCAGEGRPEGDGE